MSSRTSFPDALEDLNAMILAADPRDAKAITQLAEHLEGLLAAVEPASPTAELLQLGLSGLQNIDKSEGSVVLSAVASAVAASAECLDGEVQRSSAALEVAAAALRELLEPQPNTPSSPAMPGPVSGAPAGAVGACGREDVLGSCAAAFHSDPELLKEFVAESRDRIAQAEAAILVLEAHPDDSEPINLVLRAFHTIKGGSGLLGLTPVQALAHHAESLLIRSRDGEIRMIGQNIDLALHACDALKFMIDGLETTGPGHAPPAPANLDELVEALSEHERSRTDTQPNGTPACSLGVATSSANAPRENTDPADVEQREPLVADVLGARPSAESDERAASPGSQQSPWQTVLAAEASVRVNTKRLDHLVNLIGELVIAQSIVVQDSKMVEANHARLARSVSHAGKIVRQLQDLAMSLRMVPLKGTFQKMARLVRDLAHKSGKTIQFHATGEDTEIDRNMVEVLDDPLAHMIRNAVDHGIEPAAERATRGKHRTGALQLRAYHAAGNVVIELEDDGKGLDRDKIFQKAVQRGLVEAGRDMPDNEIEVLVFHPGLSTADKVTNVSGRGVGLDVVKRNIESLRGRIELTTRPGEGTKFTLRLPLTMAIIDAMLVRVGEQQYLLPTIAIQRSFRPEPGAVSTVTGRGEMVMLHGRLHPLFRLHKLFNIEGAVSDPHQAMVIVLEGVGKRCALMVDEILGQQQAVVKSLGKALANIPGVAGGAILGDGRVGFILDTVDLMRLAHGQTKTPPCAITPEQPT